MKITKVLNGYMYATLNEEGEEEDIIVGTGESEDEVSDFINFLYAIDNYFGPSTSKYSKKRLRILALPGSSYMETLDEKYEAQLKDHLLDLACAIGFDKSIKFLQDTKDQYEE